MLKSLEEAALNALWERHGSVRLNGLFLLVFSPASDPHVFCRLELTLSKEKHLVSLHIDHSWSTTHPRFKHNVLTLIRCQKLILYGIKSLGPQNCAELSGPLHCLETNRYQVGHVSASNGNLVLIKMLTPLSLAHIHSPISMHYCTTSKVHMSSTKKSYKETELIKLVHT